MRKNYLVFILGGALALVIGLAAFGMTQTTASSQVHIMTADYPTYASVGEIANQSTLVVRGRVTGVLPTYRVIPDSVPLDKLPAHKAREVGYLQTDVAITIDTVIAGPAELRNTTVNVTHHGGQLAGSTYVMEDEPISAQGQNYLLFLREAEPGRYVIVGGPQGRYLIQQGRLNAISEHASELYPLVGMLRGMDAASFVQNFAALKNRAAPAAPPAAPPASGPVAPVDKPAHP